MDLFWMGVDGAITRLPLPFISKDLQHLVQILVFFNDSVNNN